MKYIIIFFIIFIIVYLVMYLYNRLSKHDYSDNQALIYVVKKNKLKMNLERNRLLTKVLMIDNSVIVSIPIEFVLFSKLKFGYILLISLGTFVTLMLLTYSLIGKYFKKVGW